MGRKYQQAYDSKNGLVSKTYKLKGQIVEDFKKACQAQNASQATVLHKLMTEYIEQTQNRRK